MAVDVLTEVVIDRPRDLVAAYAADPSNAPKWYVNIESIDWKTPPPVRIGSRMDFVARFLGRRLAYTYEVVDLVPGERLYSGALVKRALKDGENQNEDGPRRRFFGKARF